MQYLHLVTGLFSLVNSAAAVPARPEDSHAIVLLYQSQPSSIVAFREAAAKLLPGSKVVVLEQPSQYRHVFASRGYFADEFDDPDRIIAFHSHSIPEHDAILKGFPDATLSLVDEGAASYYPNLIDRHLDIDRIDHVYLHEYLGIFRGHETTGLRDKIKRIDRRRFTVALKTVSTLAEGSGRSKDIDGRPVVVLMEQYFFQKSGVDITISEQAQVYADAIEAVVSRGYAVEYRRHPREANKLFEKTLRNVGAETRRWVRLDTRSVALSEFDLIAGNLPAAVLGVSSTTMLTAPHFFGVPSFRIDTDLALRLAKASYAESSGIVNNHARFRAAIPPVAMLPAAGAAEVVSQVFSTNMETATASIPALDAALFTAPGLPATAIDGIRQVIAPDIKTVSFDAFDTLVVRKGTNTTDTLALADRCALDEGLLPAGLRFSAVRIGAPKRMRATAQEELAEKPEYTLDDIYAYVARALDISTQTRDRLRQIEIEVESTHITARRFGASLLALAQLYGKRTVITSDTFFNRSEFDRIVSEKLPVRADETYLSSELQATKSTGDLFRVLLDREGVAPGQIVHIGDNGVADVENPRRLGIGVVHTPSVHDAFFSRSALGARLKRERSKRAFSLTYSVVARKFFDTPGDRVLGKALSRSDTYFVGYAIVGPAYLHWVLWIAREAQRRGFDELLFLARDGALPIRIYDLVKKVWPGAPEAKYVYASRAVAVNVYSQYSGMVAYSEEIHGFGPRNTPEQVVGARFGDEALAMLRPHFPEYGLGDGTEPVGERLMSLRALLAEHAQSIAGLKKADANMATEYYRAAIDSRSRPAVVDFGYSGSTQRAIVAAVGRRVGGFYFTRKENNVDFADSMSMESFAYSDSATFLNNGAFIEFMTTPESLRTVLNFTRAGDEIVPVFAESGQEYPEIRKLQQGILDFARDYIGDFGTEVPHITCRPELATFALANFLSRPLPGDFTLFDDMGHEDTIGADLGPALAYWHAGRDYLQRKSATIPRMLPGIQRLAKTHFAEVAYTAFMRVAPYQVQVVVLKVLGLAPPRKPRKN